MKNILALLILCAVAVACSPMEPPSGNDANAAPGSTEGLPDAPDFELASLGGGTLGSEDLKGRVVVVDVWATWCAPCIEEIPNFNALHAEQDESEFELVGITVESGSFETVQKFLADRDLGIEYPVVMGDEAVVQGFGGILGFPTTFVVSPDWKIYKKYLGQRTNKKELIEQDILDLLAARDRNAGTVSELLGP